MHEICMASYPQLPSLATYKFDSAIFRLNLGNTMLFSFPSMAYPNSDFLFFVFCACRWRIFWSCARRAYSTLVRSLLITKSDYIAPCTLILSKAWAAVWSHVPKSSPWAGCMMGRLSARRVATSPVLGGRQRSPPGPACCIAPVAAVSHEDHWCTPLECATLPRWINTCRQLMISSKLV